MENIRIKYFTDKIDKLGSKRGAALYKFNGKAYRKDPKFKL